MKKFFVFFLVLAGMLVLGGCGKDWDKIRGKSTTSSTPVTPPVTPPAPTGPFTAKLSVSQSSKGDVTVALQLGGAEQFKEAAITVKGNLRGTSPTTFTADLGTVTTSSSTLSYISSKLDLYDWVKIEGTVTGGQGTVLTVSPLEFQLNRILASQVTVKFPQGSSSDTWGFGIKRSSSTLLPNEGLKITVKIYDGTGVRTTVYTDLVLAGGNSNEVKNSNPDLIHGWTSGDTKVEITFTGDNFASSVVWTFNISGDMKNQTKNLYISP